MKWKVEDVEQLFEWQFKQFNIVYVCQKSSHFLCAAWRSAKMSYSALGPSSVAGFNKGHKSAYLAQEHCTINMFYVFKDIYIIYIPIILYCKYCTILYKNTKRGDNTQAPKLIYPLTTSCWFVVSRSSCHIVGIWPLNVWLCQLQIGLQWLSISVIWRGSKILPHFFQPLFQTVKNHPV